MDPAKKSLRKLMLAQRQVIHTTYSMDTASYQNQLLRRALPAIEVRLGSQNLVIAGFYPINSEIDCAFLLRRLISKGFNVCLPVVLGKGLPLFFRRWDGTDTNLVEAEFHVKVPNDRCEVCEPDVLLVPMLAFNSRKMRLGYGGGFYDRTLSDLRKRKRVLAVGIAFEGQRMEDLPCSETDQPVDIIVTEHGLWEGGIAVH